ncbi:MAG TPA: DNA repair protein RecO [Phycisphaerae bacterium]|nr:DNA repair protein RecO [Phycisphaerae bacterium]
MRQRDRAICLAATDYSETSQVVHFLTRAGGVVRLLAKGAKRPKARSGGAIDLLAEGELVLIASRGEGLGTLVEFTETDSRGPMRKSAAALNAGLYMVELVGRMVADADPHPEVFDLLHNSLARLSEPGAPLSAVVAYFQWRLLRHVGLLGRLRRCVSCGTPVGGWHASAPRQARDHKTSRSMAAGPAGRDVYFSSRLGGLLCGACEGAAAEKYRLDGQALAGLAALAAAEAGTRVNLPARQADRVNRLLAYHVTEQTGKPLRMARYVLSTARSR